MSVSADFETGVNGNNVATSDTGSATAWNAVNGTNKPAYDNTHIHTGSLACKMASGTAGNPSLSWSTAYGTQTDHYGRFYIWLSANPAASVNLFGCSGCFFIILTSTGALRLADGGFTTLATFTNSITTGQWCRVEWHATHGAGATGTLEVKLFNSAESMTATETKTAISVNIGASATSWFIGVDQDNVTLWVDDIIAAAASYPGPTATATFVQKINGYIVQ